MGSLPPTLFITLDDVKKQADDLRKTYLTENVSEEYITIKKGLRDDFSIQNIVNQSVISTLSPSKVQNKSKNDLFYKWQKNVIEKRTGEYQLNDKLKKFSRCFVGDEKGFSKTKETAEKNRVLYYEFFERLNENTNDVYEIHYDKRSTKKGKIMKNGRMIKSVG